MLKKAAFVDRDGVINEEKNYVYRIDDFNFLPGVFDGLKLLRDAGYLLIVITNQSGIARGYYGERDLHDLHAYMRSQLGLQGIILDAVYYCPHHPDGVVSQYSVRCTCRKPRPGMILQAEHDLGIDLANSLMIGDKETDIVAGRMAGVGCNIIVESGHLLNANAYNISDFSASNLYAAVQRFLREKA